MYISQLIINIVITFSIYLLVSFSFSVYYTAIGFFNLAHAAIIALAAYFSYFFTITLGLNLILSILLSIVLSLFIAIIIYKLAFNTIRSNNSFQLMIASFGVYIIIENLLSIIWGDTTKSLKIYTSQTGNEVFGGYVTNIQFVTIITSLLIFAGLNIFIAKSNLGRKIRAVSSNNELSHVFGVNSNKIILWSLALGSSVAALTGILVSFDTGMIPTMGFNILLYGIIAMIIGGINSSWGLVGSSLLLASVQHLGAFYIDSKWMDAIAYLILIIFLFWRPLGFSGNRLKKAEI